MNLGKKMSTIALKEQNEKAVSTDLLHPFEDPGEERASLKFQRYKNIFSCKYTAIKD